MDKIVKQTMLNIFETALNKDIESADSYLVESYKDEYDTIVDSKDIQIYVTDRLYFDDTVLCVIINDICYDVSVKRNR